MASKLDELMALADYFGASMGDFARHNTPHNREDAKQARRSLQSALKALVEDAERYQHWRKIYINSDGKMLGGALLKAWTEESVDAAIDAARKP